jgi:hypothetical protein
MQPRALLGDGGESLGQIIVLINKSEPDEMTTQFQHLFRRTHDPAARYESAIRYLAAAHYQRPQEFSDELTALFGPESQTALRLLEAGSCRLEFEQYSQRFVLPCRVMDLPESDPAYQATYWHNSLFNPAIPEGVRILGFRPDWPRAIAEST